MAESHDQRITYFGETDFRNKKAHFGIKAKDRTRHMYVIGKTGVGKSTLLSNMIIQDIQNGEGVGVIDPHGELAESVLDYVPEDRIKDVIYFAPFDTEYPMSFNVLEDIGEDKRHLVVSGLMSVFKKIWQDAWSARMEYILNNTLLALLEYPGSTLMGVNKMLSDKDFRKKIVENVKDPAVKSFWVDEYAKYTEKFAAEATPAIQNKIGQYTLNPLIRNIIGQPVSSFDIRDIMDNKKIFIINLSKGRIGEQNMNLLGGMFVTKIYLAAMSRAELAPDDMAKLPPFYFYVDEFQNFANESFAQILSEARKYKLALTVANQYVTQMVDEVRDAILGNVGSMITFRIGPTDAEVFEKEFAPTFVAQDLTNLGFAQIYLRLMIDGMTSKPFSATTLSPIAHPEKNYREQIIDWSRSTYARPKAVVEENIRSWHQESHVEKRVPIPPRDTTTVPAPSGMKKPFEGKIPTPNPISVVSSSIAYRSPQERPKIVPSRSSVPPRVYEKREPIPPRPQSSHPPHSGNQIHHQNTAEKTAGHTTLKSSPKLNDILTTLERDETEEVKVEPKKEEKKTIPLSSLSLSKKDPSPEKKAELKALLSRVMSQEQKQPHVSNEPTIQPAKNEPINKEENHTHKETTNKKSNPREVPEDVLRKILSS